MRGRTGRLGWLSALTAVTTLLVGLGLLVAPAARAVTVDGGTVTPGTPFTATFANAFDDVTYSVDVPAGRSLTLTVDPASDPISASVNVLSGGGFFDPGQIGNQAGQSPFTEVAAAPTDRTLSIQLFGFAPGSLVLVPALVADSNGTIGWDVPTHVALSTPGQRARLTFDVGVQTRVGVLATGIQWNASTLNFGDPVRVDLIGPDGGDVTLNQRSAGFWDALDVTPGQWTLVVDGLGDSTGSLDISISSVTDIGGTVVLGADTTVGFDTPWTRLSMTVPGAVGRRIRLDVVASSLTAKAATGPVLLAGLSSPFSSEVPLSGGTGTQVFDSPLPTADPQTLTMHLDGIATGSVTFRVSYLPVDPVTTLALDTPTTVSIAAPFANRRIQLPVAPADARTALVVTANTFTGVLPAAGYVDLGIVDADGLPIGPVLLQLNPGQASGFLELAPGQINGGTLLIDPIADSTGSLTIEVRTLPDVTTPITRGVTATARATAPGTRLIFTAQGVPGSQAPVVRLSGQVLRRADGTQGFAVLSALQDGQVKTTVSGIDDSSRDIELTGVDPSRPWSVVVAFFDDATGAVPLTWITPRVTSRTVTSGQRTTLTFTGPADYARLSFNVAAGQHVLVSQTGSTVPTTLRLETAGGALIDQRFDNADLTEFNPATAAGTQVLLVDPVGTALGSVTVTVVIASDITSTIKEPRTVSWSAGQNVNLKFSAAAGSRPVLQVTRSKWTPQGFTNIALFDPHGNFITTLSQMVSGQTMYLESFPLPETGTYTLLIDPSGLSVGSLSLSLKPVTDLAVTAVDGRPLTTAFPDPGINATVSLAVTKGTGVRWAFAQSTLRQTTLVLVDPFGSLVGSATVGPGTSSGTFGGGSSLTPGTYRLLVDPVADATGRASLTLRAV